MEQVHLKRTKRLRSGHLWVFSNEIAENPKQYQPGSLVSVHDSRDEFLGIGYINPQSLIAVRLLTRRQEPLDHAFFRDRIERASALRERFFPGAVAYRAVFSEADGMPGLIVDRYDRCCVIQILTAGMEMLRTPAIDAVDEVFAPETIVLRNDSRMRSLEGLAMGREVIKGSLDRLPEIREDGLSFLVDPMEGQKTGFFLDQRMNRLELSRYVRAGKGLDLFCYAGAWSLHAAAAGAEVTAVDSSETALAMAARNADLNRMHDRIRLVRADVFAFLGQEMSGSRDYDFIVCDPPAFVKSSRHLKEATKAYRELNSLCMQLLRPGGILISSSCSYHLSRELFIEMLLSAAKESGRSLRLLSLRSQSPDHPVLLAMPETEYLKCAFLVVD